MATFKQYEKQDGSKAWQFQSYLGINPKTGKSIKTTRRNFKTKKEAQLELNRLLASFENEGLKKQEKIKFKEVYQMWFDNYKSTVKEATSLATERHIRLRVLPVLGDIYVDKIDTKTAQKLVNSLSNKLQTYRAVIQYCSKIMRFAIHLDFLEKNPFENTVRPISKKTRAEKDVKFYTAEQINLALDYLSSKATYSNDKSLLSKYFSHWDYTMYRLLAFSGLRGGEALALNFDDIDFTNKTLTVNKTLSQTKYGYKIESPKTKSSNRVISLDDKTIQILKKWQLLQKKFLFENGGKNINVIFPNIDGDYSNRQSLYQRSARLAKSVGLPNIGTHGWRHSHASLLYSAGATMKEAQERLGHSSMEITHTIYTHLSDKQKNETADKLAKFANF